MQRTQIYLSEKERNLLSSISVSEHRTVSELIREAIDKCYSRKKHDFVQALDKAGGIWKDREDIKTDYVRKLRADRRSRAIG
ncbi:MAG: hypothetical protein AUJ85_03155 [Elusimicrobia bacterium CG1_02_37_114]|nr:MAG: hypothetical protein AUJ85_03155 [Elusimicrobia bacterium CG1_02_37_114]PIV53123.1 MAG: CopG family transcriptional regulator [Elusimicrobia bacterium CG02_land_8_20_14_3_00_37_13]PIZ12789.1 MAG: CopG family transcriptional regulator [Elusimicrobia bacterium CG_4_10_14_0_8_um_filter_37_32]